MIKKILQNQEDSWVEYLVRPRGLDRVMCESMYGQQKAEEVTASC